MWWLKNQALPSTQAFFALVMRVPSTVSSMSSQTQPQKVQVASLTIFSSAGAAAGDSVFSAMLMRHAFFVQAFSIRTSNPLLSGMPLPCVSPPISRLDLSP